MRKYLFILSASFLVWSCGETAENVETTETPQENQETQVETPEEVLNYYGAEITPNNAIASTELLAMLEGKDSVEVKVEAVINECCQKKGCWMDVDLGNGESMLVKFKDYEFFVPKNAGGQTAIMEGIAKMEMQSVEWLQHKAKDAGKTEEEIAMITEPEMSVSFMANGVIIKGELPEEIMNDATEEAHDHDHDHSHEGEEHTHTHE